MIRRKVWGAAAMVAAMETTLLAYGCAGDPAAVVTGDGGIDADPDTFVRPPPRDAGADADEAVDAEGGAPGIVLKGDWQPIPNLPSKSCLYATDPPKSVEPMTWDPCPGRAGCQQLKATWTPFRRHQVEFDDMEPVMQVGGAPQMVVTRGYPPSEFDIASQTMMVVESLSGAVKFAMASSLGDVYASDYCLAVRPSLSATTVAVQTLLVGPRDAAPILQTHFIWASLGAPQSTTAFAFDTGGLLFQNDVQAAEDRLFVGTYPVWGALDTKTRVYQRGTQVGYLEQPRPVGGGAIVINAAKIEASLAFLSNEGNMTPLYQPAAGRTVRSVVVDRSAGERLVWVECDAGFDCGTDAVYWTAPFEGPGSTLQPRRLTGFDCTLCRDGLNMAANAGLVVNYDRYDRALVTRIDDGWSWTIPSLAGEFFARGLWADANEVWLHTALASRPDGDPSGGLDASGIVRFSLASLGTPTIPPQ